MWICWLQIVCCFVFHPYQVLLLGRGVTSWCLADGSDLWRWWKMWRYKPNSQILELKSLWRFFLMLDLFLWDFAKQIAQCFFSKGNSPTVRDLAELRFSLCCWELASTWLPEHQGVRGITYLHCCILQIQLSDSWDTGLQGFVRDQTSKPSSISEVPVLISYLFVRFLAKKHLKKCHGFHFGIHQAAQKHLHHGVIFHSWVSESVEILHHLTSLDFSPKRSLRWHLKHLEVADAAKIHPSTRLKRYQLGGWVLLPSRLLQDLHLNCKHWYKTRCQINYCNHHFLCLCRDSGEMFFWNLCSWWKFMGCFCHHSWGPNVATSALAPTTSNALTSSAAPNAGMPWWTPWSSLIERLSRSWCLNMVKTGTFSVVMGWW